MVNNQFILGINGGLTAGYQDIAAVIMQNGKVIAAIEEERINRIKHSPGHLPVQSIKEVLRIANINISDVALVGYHGGTWQNTIDQVLINHFESYFGYSPAIKRYHHHDCHAASAYYASGFEEALIITIDGSGDGVSTQIAIGNFNDIKAIQRYARPQSLGLYYSMFTQLCGFMRDADEYKLMGLAAYGDASKINIADVLQVNENGYLFNEKYIIDMPFGTPSPHRYNMLFTEHLTSLLNTNRRQGEITSLYKHIAAGAQMQLEKALISLIKKYVAETGIKKICMAGGVALNCLANQKIEALTEVEALFVQPASSDAGISLGAAYLASLDFGVKDFKKQTHTFYGNEFSNEEIKVILERCNINFTKIENLTLSAACKLADNKVIGWFQGKMEFGPRALGNRSILANPAILDIKQIVNQKIKFREGFRPFGASVLEEDFHTYFEAKCLDAPYMTKVFTVKPEYQKILSGVTHVDGTCRVQTVNSEQNNLYYQLLKEFKIQTGHGILLNTSFNLNHEPIVNTPREALASFFASGMDALYIGDYYVKK